MPPGFPHHQGVYGSGEIGVWDLCPLCGLAIICTVFRMNPISLSPTLVNLLFDVDTVHALASSCVILGEIDLSFARLAAWIFPDRGALGPPRRAFAVAWATPWLWAL